METVLSTLSVDFLTLPRTILDLIPPSAYRYTQGEPFPGRTGLLFDALGAAEGSASLSVKQILHPARMARLVAYGSMGDYPDLEEVIDRLLDVTWSAGSPNNDYQRQLLHVVQRVTVDEMMVQASGADSSGEVKAILSDRLGKLANQMQRRRNASAHQSAVAADIRRWQKRPDNSVPGPALRLPPGDPI